MLDDPMTHKGLTEWLGSRHTGASARAIVAEIASVGEKTGLYPSDGADFERCEKLLTDVPSLRLDFIGRMPEVNAYWAALVPEWENIKAAEDKGQVIRRLIDPIEADDPSHAKFNDQMSMRVGGPVTFKGDVKSAPVATPEVNDDSNLTKAALLVWNENKASTSFVQRRLGIGYNKASRLIEKLEDLGIVSKANEIGKREVRKPEEIAQALEISNSIIALGGEDHARAVFAEALRAIGEFPELQPSDQTPPMKETAEDQAVRDTAYGVAAGELQQFVERYERLEAEKQAVADQQKEVMAEAKGRGYDTKVLRKIIALRKREPDDIAEEEAILDMYKAALGMA